MHVQLIGDGPKNVTVWIRGRFPAEPSPIELFGLEDMRPPAKGVTLGSALWCIEEKAGGELWAGEEGEWENFLLVMESRNGLRPDHPLPMPKRWNGRFYLVPLLPMERCAGKLFWLILDFDKVLR